jgi:hypothetical protein
MKRFILVLCCLFGLTQARPVVACDVCAVYSSLEARESRPGFNVGVFEQFTHFGTMQLNGKEVDNPTGQQMDSSITQFILGYQFNDRFGLQLNIPYIYRSFKRPEGVADDEFVIDRGVESGLGDMALSGNFRVYDTAWLDGAFFWYLSGGIKFPTGSASRLSEELMEMDFEGVPKSGIHGHDLALGSGSYDGIVGTSVFGKWKSLFATAGLQYAIRTKGAIDYQYANDFTWSVKPGVYLWFEDKGTLGVQLAVTGDSKGKDTFQGQLADDTAMTSLFLGPEFSFTWKDKLSTDLGADLPVVQRNSALQSVPDYRVHGAVTFRF